MAAVVKTGEPKKYFLYIDILGFSALVLRGRVRDLYTRLDELNAHNHPSFSTIVFSDTIVIYNRDDLEWDESDKTALVSRLCEFAADLFYRLIDQDIHFRAYICCGEFIHSKMQHIEAFYGQALVESYRREHEIQCAGLFIENELAPYVGSFESDKYDERSHFVHLLEYIRYVRSDSASYPLAPGSVDFQKFVSYDLRYLRNIYTHMSDMDLTPRVRVKYLSAWQMIRKRNGLVLDLLERDNFDPRSIGKIDQDS